MHFPYRCISCEKLALFLFFFFLHQQIEAGMCCSGTEHSQSLSSTRTRRFYSRTRLPTRKTDSRKAGPTSLAAQNQHRSVQVLEMPRALHGLSQFSPVHCADRQNVCAKFWVCERCGEVIIFFLSLATPHAPVTGSDDSTVRVFFFQNDSGYAMILVGLAIGGVDLCAVCSWLLSFASSEVVHRCAQYRSFRFLT